MVVTKVEWPVVLTNEITKLRKTEPVGHVLSLFVVVIFLRPLLVLLLQPPFSHYYSYSQHTDPPLIHRPGCSNKYLINIRFSSFLILNSTLI